MPSLWAVGRGLDRAAGWLGGRLGTAGQLGLLALGLHAVGDRLDDRVLDAVETLGVVTPVPGLAGAFALLVELLAIALLADGLLLTPRVARLDLARLRAAFGHRALALGLALPSVGLAGGGVVAMAVEDALGASALALPLGSLAGLLAALRLGLPAVARCLGALQRPRRPERGGPGSLLLLLVAGLALAELAGRWPGWVG